MSLKERQHDSHLPIIDIGTAIDMLIMNPPQRELKPETKLKSVNILGVHVHNVSMDEVLCHLELMARDEHPHHVVTVNPEFIMAARNDEPFCRVLNCASLALPDGIGIVWASRWLRQPMKERVTGVDTVNNLAAIAQRHKLRMFLLGAAPGVAECAASRLQQNHPGLIICGTYAGSPDQHEEDEICHMVQAARPHILLVAYGAPKQDLWIHRNLQRLHVPLAIGVGGTFDFIAEIILRAPQWMQRLGLEWLYRLIKEPSRWRRMLALPRFAIAVLLSSRGSSSKGRM